MRFVISADKVYSAAHPGLITELKGQAYMDSTTLMLSNLFGSVGMGLFAFRKKQGRPFHLLAGVVLMVLPYCIPNAIALGIVGVLLTIAPFLIA